MIKSAGSVFNGKVRRTGSDVEPGKPSIHLGKTRSMVTISCRIYKSSKGLFG